ncbi:MAG TPA: large conductance mechanosensitive channel protein MscL [Longimicrobium sp.]|jgi:large conductance mechanosensitive channel|uniref:large conductance mechanosensitive channel protein MscL n=1 Tax=Longimicrobium sp. TaxID=2029185 RepID=UPI002EDB9F52
MLSGFRSFIARGNVMDLAVGIVIGAAFTTVVKSFVDDILMPPIGMLLGGVDFSELYLPLSGERFATRAAAVEAGAPIISYGVFLNNVLAFLITAFAVYLLVKSYDRLRARQAAAPPQPSEKDCPFCRSRIHIAATRCPACTSDLGGTVPA